MGRRWVRTAAAAGVVALAVAGCAGGDGGEGVGATSVDGAPVLSTEITRAGATLPDGFTVPSGAVLLGVPMPTGVNSTFNGVAVPERGWIALLLVTGDPYRVLDHVRADAARAGMPPSLNAGSCDENAYVHRVECSVSAHSPGNSEYPVRGARVSAELVRSTSESGRPPISHLVLAYSEVEPATPREPEPAPAPLPRTVRMPPFPDAWPPLAGPGDPIPSSVGGERFVFEPGARLVGPPSSIGSVTGGFEMVLELTGDPQRVVDAYRTQFEHAGFTPVRAPFGDDAPGTGPSARYTQSGGGEVSAITVTGDDGHRFLWLTRAND